MYDTPASLLSAVAAGEDSLLEIKEVSARGNKLEIVAEGQATNWLARQLSAFTNADGGVLALGFRNDGHPIGIPSSKVDDLQQMIANTAREAIEPPMDHLIRIDAMQIPSGTVSSNGRCTVPA